MSSSSFSPTIPIGYGVVVPGSTNGLVSSSGLPGNTTGSAIAAGYVGEKVVGTVRTITTTAGAYVTGANECITLDKGIYLMFVKGSWLGNNTASVIAFGVSSTANTRTAVDSIFGEGLPSSYNGTLCANDVTTTVDYNVFLGPPFYLNVSANSTKYYPTVYSEDQSSLSVEINMAAIRIA